MSSLNCSQRLSHPRYNSNPLKFTHDTEVTLKETWGAMEKLVEAGLVRVGVDYSSINL